MRRIVTLLGSLMLLSHLIFAQDPSVNVELGSRVTFPNQSSLNDVWGFVGPDEKEYALVGLSNGVGIVDVTVPDSAETISVLPGVYSFWRDLKTWGNYAYVSNESADGIRIIDLNDMQNISFKDTALAGIQTSHNLWVDEFGYLYVAGDNVNAGLTIFDLNPNPWIPQFVGAYNLRYVHDVYVRNNLAYCAEIFDGLLTILDVSDKGNPVVLGTRTYSGAFTHNTWLNDDGTVCYTTDEVSAAYINAWDVTDPTNITFIDKIRSPLSGGTTIPHNVHVLDDILITSYYRDGIYVVDGTHPHFLIEIGYYDTSPLTGDGFNGSWGAYPFLPSGNILASDIERGLFVLKPKYQKACFIDATIVDAISGDTLENVVFNFASNFNGITGTDGSFFYGLADSGTYDLFLSKFGYGQVTIPIPMRNGVTLDTLIQLSPANSVDYTFQVLDAEDNSPVKDVIVEAIQQNGPYELDFRTDPNGEIVSQLESGDYLVTVGKWGYITQEMVISANPSSPQITILLERGYKDEFALDLGWFIALTDTGGWELGEPIGTFFVPNVDINPEEDLPNDIGNQCYLTGNAGLPLEEDGLSPNSLSILISPPIDMAGYTEPMIRLYYWLVNFDFTNSIASDGYLEITLSNSLGDFPIVNLNGSLENNWNLIDSIRVLDYVGSGEPFYVKFNARGSSGTGLLEAAIDGFEVFEGAVIDTTGNTHIELNDIVKSFTIVGENELAIVDYEFQDIAPNQKFSLEISDLQGRLIHSVSLSGQENHLQIPFSQPEGIYIATIRKNHQMISAKKWINR